MQVTTQHVLDHAGLRALYGSFPTGVAAVGAHIQGTPIGMAASSFTSVSFDPPLVSVAVQNTSRTWQVLRTAPRIGITILARNQAATCRQLSLREGDRFADVPWSRTAQGAVHIAGGISTLDCSLHSEVAAGDHAIALFVVHDFALAPTTDPLVFHASSFKQLAAS
ncbi:flavin reductase family protein [Rhodococcus opacus]|uniref:flavin reductase family protein n=1 Tax=Rhodococcus opacus TaxID=37919 RepID=UPI00155A8447